MAQYQEYNFLDCKVFLILNVAWVPRCCSEPKSTENQSAKTTTKTELLFTGVISSRFRMVGGTSEVRGFQLTRLGCAPKEQLLRKLCAPSLFLGFFAHLATGATPKCNSEPSQMDFRLRKSPIASGFSFEHLNPFDLACSLPLRGGPNKPGPWYPFYVANL